MAYLIVDRGWYLRYLAGRRLRQSQAPHIGDHVPHLRGGEYRRPWRHGEPPTLVSDPVPQRQKELGIAQALHGCEIAMVCRLMPDALHIGIVVSLTLASMAVIAQALINTFAIKYGAT